ncbi:MAG TPA: M91 family zinc metallopeptidase [Chloroflexota bacterium]|nr:M91 family zinc metallopeptidase [Chloroflexota bacterium]
MADKKKKLARRQAAKKRAMKKSQHTALVEPLQPAAENEFGDGLSAHVSMSAQSQLLGHTHLSSVQRQEVARHIGEAGGNHHLARVIGQMQTAAGSEFVQKNGETLVDRGGGSHEVVAGDSLWRIAEQTYGHGRYWRDIYRANPDKAARGGDLILVGVILTLPVLRVPGEAPPEPEPGGGGTEPAVEPIGISTEFGNFDVYPDEFVGPLPLSVRSAESWPIRQSEYDALMDRLTEVSNNTSNLIVTGTDDFKAGVMLDLGWLMTSGVGQELVQEIQDSPHTVTIQVGGGGNATSYNPDADSYERPVSPPEAGPGANVTITYNPNVLFIKSGALDWHHRPPAIGLAHEMVHAWTGVYGTRALGTDAAGVKRRELQATGLGEFVAARITENRFRAAFGLPLRPVY